MCQYWAIKKHVNIELSYPRLTPLPAFIYEILLKALNLFYFETSLLI